MVVHVKILSQHVNSIQEQLQLVLNLQMLNVTYIILTLVLLFWMFLLIVLRLQVLLDQ